MLHLGMLVFVLDRILAWFAIDTWIPLHGHGLLYSCVKFLFLQTQKLPRVFFELTPDIEAASSVRQIALPCRCARYKTRHREPFSIQGRNNPPPRLKFIILILGSTGICLGNPLGDFGLSFRIATPIGFLKFGRVVFQLGSSLRKLCLTA